MNFSSETIIPSTLQEDNTTFKVFLLIISCPLIFLTIVGNSLIILSWLLQKSIRSSPSNFYFISLAFADLITGLFAFPPTVHYSYLQRWVYGLGVCRVWLVMCFAMYTITAFHLVAVALDRYRTLMHGVTYLQQRTLKSIVEKVVIIWIMGLWVTLPVILDWEHVSRDPTAQKHCVSNKIPYWVAHYSCASFWFPALILIRIYIKVYQEIKGRLRSKLTVKSPESNNTTESKEIDSGEGDIITDSKNKMILARERRSAITLVIISGAFIFCWLPWNALTLFDVLGSKSIKPSPYMYMSSAIFGLANSCINPLVYTARIPEFRKAMKKIFKKSSNCS